MDCVDRAALPTLDNHHELEETQQSQSCLHGSQHDQKQEKMKNSKYVGLGSAECSRRAHKSTLWAIAAAFFLIALPVTIAKSIPAHPPPPDSYTVALHKALLFFNAQKSGRLPKNNGIPWRGNSGLSDRNTLDSNSKRGLVGGYYDAGDNIKFHFPMSFAMTMLSWSMIEYSHKYKAIDEYDHTRELIKWGTDYLLLTFNSSATKIDKIYSQVGGSQMGWSTPDDHYCWQKPEDMDYPRPVQMATSGPDLAGEMAAALAAASIVFRDKPTYSRKLIQGAKTVFAFARDFGRRKPYCRGNPYVEPYYNSTGYFDEYLWGAAWLYYATGNNTYLLFATNPGLSRNSKALHMLRNNLVLSWDNKLPAAMLLLTRMRIMLSPGYPYENMLRMYHNVTSLTMCSYLHQFGVFNWTKGGMIQLNGGQAQPLQYMANAAFLASLFVDYLNATGVPGWTCGQRTVISSKLLWRFATSQINYILGDNPMKMSYVVGYGTKFPRRVHHRAASIPSDKKRYSCTGGWKWRDTRDPNPHNITGAMVGGPDRFDQFHDLRGNFNYTEPTMAGNAGLVAALVSLTTSGGTGVDRSMIFSAVRPFYHGSRPPPPRWRP